VTDSKKYLDHVSILVDKLKDKIEFVEPQSMNFDIKLNQAYLDFLKTEN